MDNRILVISGVSDLHADIVEGKLKLRGARPFRINLDEFPRDFSLDFRFDPQGASCALQHVPSGDTLTLAEIGAVWCRKPAKFRFLSNDLSVQEEAFAQAETEHLFFSLLYSIDCYWMSHPLATRSALWKGEQLQRASRMGFRIPRSIITNCPQAARDFRHRVGGDMIFKTMSSPSLCAQDVAPEDRRYNGLPTTRITGEHFEAAESVRQLPCLFQEHVAKKHELRVTVIGHEAFTASIHSQGDDRTRVDYRNFSAEIPYEAETLTDEVAARCIDFVRSYGLEFGALDLIVTPEDELVFLENNPGGQFLFVEQLVPELKMTDAVADLLSSRATSRKA